MSMDKAIELQERIARLEARQTELLTMLGQSLKLKTHFPDAFEHGKASTGVRGNPDNPEELRFIVTRGDGSERELPALAVPPALWQGCLRRFVETRELAKSSRKIYKELLRNV